MPFIETPKEHRFPWYVKLFFWNQRRKYGAVLEPARLWGRSPKVFITLASLYGALDRRSSPIEPALRSLITVRVSQINWCAFCVDINLATVLKRGVDEDKLAALAEFQASPLFSEREKAALAYAEAVTYSDRHATPEHFVRLRRHFDDDAIKEKLGVDGRPYPILGACNPPLAQRAHGRPRHRPATPMQRGSARGRGLDRNRRLHGSGGGAEVHR